MKYALVTIAIVGTLSGCARFRTVQTDSSDPKTQARSIKTETVAYTFFAGRADLAKLSATQTDKTQSLKVGSLFQAADASTNLNSVIEAVVRAAIGAAK